MGCGHSPAFSLPDAIELPIDKRSSLPSRPTHSSGQAREDPIVISDSDSDSEGDKLEDDGLVGPRIPVWVYKMKPTERTAPSGDPSVSSRSAEDGASSFSDCGVSATSTRKAQCPKPGGCGGLVQRKTRWSRLQQVRSVRSPKVITHDLAMRRGCGHTQVPPELEEALPDLQAQFPRDHISVGYHRLTNDTIKWGYRCLTCPDASVSLSAAMVCAIT